jgi:hypothetical protein
VNDPDRDVKAAAGINQPASAEAEPSARHE